MNINDLPILEVSFDDKCKFLEKIGYNIERNFKAYKTYKDEWNRNEYVDIFISVAYKDKILDNNINYVDIFLVQYVYEREILNILSKLIEEKINE